MQLLVKKTDFDIRNSVFSSVWGITIVIDENTEITLDRAAAKIFAEIILKNI